MENAMEALAEAGASSSVFHVKHDEKERKLVHGCSRCPARWNGKKTAHCPTCHETFSGPSAFDQHRSAGICSEERGMIARGLALQERAGYVVWGFAQTDDRWDDTLSEDNGEEDE